VHASGRLQLTRAQARRLRLTSRVIGRRRPRRRQPQDARHKFTAAARRRLARQRSLNATLSIERLGFEHSDIIDPPPEPGEVQQRYGAPDAS
jgi:hypothetical protein